MVDTPSQPRHSDDEIDLVELIANLWKEKVSIFLCTTVVAIAGLIYALTSAPIYKATSQLIVPSSADINFLNKYDFFSVSPEDSFNRFLLSLRSNNHLINLITQEPELASQTIEVSLDNNPISKINKSRKISLPKKQLDGISINSYALSIEGKNREALIDLLSADLILASELTTKSLKEDYQSQLQSQINSLTTKNQTALNKLDDKLTARKSYVISLRKDRIFQLNEALKIAKALNFKSPTSLSKLSNNQGNKKVEINAELNNKVDPLYLKGTRLLNAELQSLQGLKDTVYLDEEIRELETSRLILQNDRETAQLKEELASFKQSKNEVTFYINNINSPNNPIKPKKTLIVAISILLGGLLGIFAAIGKMTYRNYKRKTNAA